LILTFARSSQLVHAPSLATCHSSRHGGPAFHQPSESQGAPKEKKKNRGYIPTFFEIFLRFSGLILENILMVFLGSSCRETAKNAIIFFSMGKDERKKVFFPQLFRPEVFDIDFPQKVFMVFLNSPC
jgi:hypothetical protein